MRVCPECGAEAGAELFCANCGRNLSREKRLPTREAWEAARTRAAPAQHNAGNGIGAPMALRELVRMHPQFAIGAVAGLVIVVIAVMILASAGGPSVQDMEHNVASYYEPTNIVCEGRGSERFYCSMTGDYRGGIEHCEGAVLVEYKPDAGDDFIQLAGYGDYNADSGAACYPSA